MMKNQKGVTLIALVITIIVLLILAGVSIAMLTGDNGILTQANKSQVSTIEGNVKEAVRLAVQAAKMDAEQQAIASETTWRAEKHTESVINVLKEDLPSDAAKNEPYTITGTDAAGNATSTELTIVYKGADYAKATNTTNATITYKVKLEGTTFTISEPTFNPTHTN